jgi:hypothetical protein
MASTKLDQWKISEIGTLDLASTDVVVRTPAFQPLVSAFKKNIERIDGLGTSVALTTGLTFMAMAKYEEARGIIDPGDAVPPLEMIANFLSHTKLYLDLSAQDRQNAMISGKSQLRVWLLHRPEIQLGMEAIFSSQIVSLWTSIETLLGDLWEVSVNIHPSILCNLRGVPKRIARLLDQSKPYKQQQKIDVEQTDSGRSVRVGDLGRVSRGSYDLSALMGTVLRDNFSFIRLEGIREAYSVAFSKNSTGIDAALASKSIDTVNIVRNVLVHSAGLADEEFVTRASSTSLPKLKIGDAFPLSGAIYQDIMNPAIRTTSKIITSVDDWISKN